VQTQPNRELRAKGQLENQAYEVFLPRRLKTVRHARKLTNVAAPFFPCYLFIRLDLTRHIAGAASTAPSALPGWSCGGTCRNQCRAGSWKP
jgi:hypothetical protein